VFAEYLFSLALLRTFNKGNGREMASGEDTNGRKWQSLSRFKHIMYCQAEIMRVLRKFTNI
jgi:hypothetical protein